MNEHQVRRLAQIQEALSRAQQWQPETANGRLDKTRELNGLMSEMERVFDIPSDESMLGEFEKRFPEVLTLYRGIFAAGDI